MATPQRAPDPRYSDPLNPIPGTTTDQVGGRFDPANASNPPLANDRVVVDNRSGGTGVLIAAVVIGLALAAYFMFAPANETVTPVDQPVTSDPAVPAPDASAPATAPDASAPATTAPTDAAPAEPAPTDAAPAPAEPAPSPATPAPAEAPAQ